MSDHMLWSTLDSFMHVLYIKLPFYLKQFVFPDIGNNV